MHKTLRSRLQNGFTLIEFMVTIALMSVALSLVVVQFNAASKMSENQALQSNLRDIVNAARMTYDTVSGYTGLSSTSIASTSQLPAHLKKLSGSSYDVYSPGLGGTVLAGPYLNGFYVRVIASAKLCDFLGSKMILDADKIRVNTGGALHSGGFIADRTTVLAGSGGTPIMDYFHYSTANRAGVCKYSSGVMVFYFDQ